jgi:hypothetical protein
MFKFQSHFALVLSLLSVCIFAQAEASRFIENFEQKSKKLEKILVQSEKPETAAQAILAEASSYRSVVFQVQAMGRVLSGVHEDFNFLRFEFKKLEDGIGENKKWMELGNVEKQSEAAEKFTDLLASEAWVGESGKFKLLKGQFGEAISRHNVTEAQVIQYWIAEADKIKNKKYDLSQLEGKIGLHEFKRDLRWVLLEMMVFPNVIGLDSDLENCPLSKKNIEYAVAGQDLKYAKLPSARDAGSAVAISSCLVATLAHLVEDIDALKTDSEKFLKDHSDNKVPPDIQDKALGTYKLFKKSKVMDLLIDQLK